MSYIIGESSSGVNWVFKRINSPVAYCAITIKGGTRDELPHQNGIAHMVEHMLFKGTGKRGALRVNNFLDRLGGELNAYTTKEETVIHATVLKEDLGKAVELLADIVFNSTFPEKEIEKEREVILEEIALYKDTPTEWIYDEFDYHLFGDHPLALPILGSEETLQKIGRSELKEFVSRHYTTTNMVFSIVADVGVGRVESLVERHFVGSINGALAPEREPKEVVAKSGELRVSKGSHQTHLVMGRAAYSLYHPKRVALALLTNMIGGPAHNSKLNQNLRERHGLVYSVDAGYLPYSDTGLFTIYLGSDSNNLERCFSIIDKLFSTICDKGFTAPALKAAKKQLIGQLAIASDNAEASLLSMGKSLLTRGEVLSLEQIREQIEAVERVELVEVASEMLDREKMFTLIYQ